MIEIEEKFDIKDGLCYLVDRKANGKKLPLDDYYKENAVAVHFNPIYPVPLPDEITPTSAFITTKMTKEEFKEIYKLPPPK